MIVDSLNYVKRCQVCQIHSSLVHQPPQPLHPTVSSWPFSQWGMDIIGPIDPRSVMGHVFILAVTNYFFKWAEAVPLKQVLGTTVTHFVRHYIIYRYGVPDRIISDNGPQFRCHHINRLVNQFGFEWRYSTMYHPWANGSLQ
ncbi:hypothetical protein AMTRI_Chr02g258940 [Amborella trichopoda]